MSPSTPVVSRELAGHPRLLSANLFWLVVLPSLLIGLQLMIHLLNGSDLICVVLLGLTLSIGMLFLNHGGLQNTISFISLIFIAKYVGIASPIKIFLGQALDSNLSHPREAFLMTFLCTVQLYAAYRLTSKYHFKLILLREIADRQYYKVLFWVSYPLGTLFFLIGACIPSYASTAGEGFQTFMLPILIVAVVARTAYLVTDPSDRRELDGTLVFMLGTSFLLAFLANLKFVAVITIMAYAVTIVVRKKTVSLRLVLLGGAGLALAVIVIFPLINLMRSASQSKFGGRSMKERTMMERIETMTVFFETQDLWGHLATYEDGSRQDSSHYPYFGNTGSYGTLLERVGMVQHADIIKSGIDSNGELGIWPAGWAFQHAVPRVINGVKTQDSMCDIMFAHAGVLPKGFKNDLTLGMVGGSYAMFGWYGVALIPFILFTCFFLQQRVWAGSSTANLWAIVLLIDSFNPFTETEPSLFIEHLIREFPLHFLALYMTQQLAWLGLRLFPGKRSARVNAAAPRARFPAQASSP
jgi:hypothetical protein